MSKKKNAIESVREFAEKTGIEMPDLVAEGDLTVEKNKPEEVVESTVAPLPELGLKFMVNGHEYKVIYVNEGKNRFSCEPCKGVY